MNHYIQVLDQSATWLAKTFIRGYQATISPTHGVFRHIRGDGVCRHDPDCSSYSLQVFDRYGFWPGLGMSLERVSQCTPANSKSYDPPYFRVVFASGSPIGVPFLRHIVDDPRFELVGVMTAPDKPQGRGQKMQPNSIKTAALEHLPEQDVITPRSVKRSSQKYSQDALEAREWLTALQPDFLVVVAYGQILPQDFLDLPKIGPVNVHGSLLPEYRGASPLQAVFLDEKQETGISIMRMVEELDSGPILDELKITLSWDRTVRDLIEWMQQSGPAFLNKTLRNRGKERLSPVLQDESNATYCSKIEKDDGLVDPYHDSLRTIYSKYRAYALWPKIFWYHQDQRIIVEKLVVSENDSNLASVQLLSEDNILHPAVQELLIKPAGKKSMSREDYLRGL